MPRPKNAHPNPTSRGAPRVSSAASVWPSAVASYASSTLTGFNRSYAKSPVTTLLATRYDVPFRMTMPSSWEATT